METNENVKNVFCEENQPVNNYFSEYNPIDFKDSSKKQIPDHDLFYLICGLSCILY